MAFNIQCGRNIVINGVPRIIMGKNSKLILGDDFRLNSGNYFNPIGRNQRSLFSIADGCILKIGNNVGMSSVAIVCHQGVTIGNNVRMGGSCCIYDTDFHSLDSFERTIIPEIKTNVRNMRVFISDNVFIGGHSTILKGVIIGANSIVGAGSVVTKNIPSNQIWAGNPAVKIKSCDITQ